MIGRFTFTPLTQTMVILHDVGDVLDGIKTLQNQFPTEGQRDPIAGRERLETSRITEMER